MITTGVLSWLSSDQKLMQLLMQNWILGIAFVALVVFCETGLVVLPFLPGDSLLFATGAFLGLNGMSVWLPIVVITLAAVAGDGVNFAIGRSRVGQQLIKRDWIKANHLAKTREYFDRYGGLTVTIGRFIPVVRTIAPFMAGLSGMRSGRFFLYNVLGAIVWCAGTMTAGIWLGKVPWIQQHMAWLSLGIVVFSVGPLLLHVSPRLRKLRR